MTEAEITRVCTWVKHGGKLLIGRDPSGRKKLKIKHGPFGLLTSRYQCSETDLQRLKARLAKPTMASQA